MINMLIPEKNYIIDYKMFIFRYDEGCYAPHPRLLWWNALRKPHVSAKGSIII
jgi:hypothetical protein